jgi:alkanesulfonate monooxygenase SsuD/methylene tetrahydromethanopterin reductase-like flavin-dependent oxidoreductase (luciferase family)
MQLGLALPQYDYSLAGERPLRFETIVGYAELANASGFESVWLSDHLFLDLEKYGGAPDREMCFDPIVTLAALARRVPDVRLGTLVFCEALRPASVLAKALATLDRVCGGRLDVGLGAGWYEPEYDAIGMTMPAPGLRIERLTEAIDVVIGVLGREPFTFDGVHRVRCPRPARRNATATPARPRGRKGQPPVAGHRRTRRRLEHVLDVDTGRVSRTPRRVGARVRDGRSRSRHRLAVARPLHVVR